MPTPRKQSLHYSCGHPSVNTTNLPQMAPDQRPPEKMPDPFLFDSEALLRELDRCRETVLQIPITNPNATHCGIQLAVSAIWNLSENLRYLLALHGQGQRQFAKKAHPAKGAPKIAAKSREEKREIRPSLI